jgi:hypothetical protein
MIMKDYSILQGALGAVFAADLARSDEEAGELLREMLSNAEYKRQFGEALIASLNDPDFSWMDALSEYEIYPADDEADARGYAIRILWSAVFPSATPPELMENRHR